MTLHEQITALLDGELADGPAVAELMHVLAVSPEKRELLVEQIALKRHVASAAAAVAPSASADRAILAGLAAVDAEFGTASAGAHGAGLAPGAGTSGSLGLSRGMAAALSLALLGAIAVGYFILRSDGQIPGDVSRAHRSVVGTTATNAVEDSLRAALAALSDERADLAGDRLSALDRIRALEQGVLYERERNRRLARELAALRAAGGSSLGAGGSSVAAFQPLQVEQRIPMALAPLAPREDAAVADGGVAVLGGAARPPGPTPAPSAVEPGISLISEAALGNDEVGPWQLGARMNFRHSMPRVYGLAGRRSALFDKEFVGSVLLGGNDDLFSALRLGAAFGETQFSIAFHTNEGGALRDSIVELSPTTLYARAFIAPELIRYAGITSGIEVGGGYTFKAGGFGSVGLNLEYRPTPDVSAQLGTSAWLLLTERASSIYLSTNLNAHIGVAFGF